MSDVSQELAALYRAESTLLARAKASRDAANEADEAGRHRQGAAFRGKAVGLHQGAQQIASIATQIRAHEAKIAATTPTPATTEENPDD